MGQVIFFSMNIIRGELLFLFCPKFSVSSFTLHLQNSLYSFSGKRLAHNYTIVFSRYTFYLVFLLAFLFFFCKFPVSLMPLLNQMDHQVADAFRRPTWWSIFVGGVGVSPCPHCHPGVARRWGGEGLWSFGGTQRSS